MLLVVQELFILFPETDSQTFLAQNSLTYLGCLSSKPQVSSSLYLQHWGYKHAGIKIRPFCLYNIFLLYKSPF